MNKIQSLQKEVSEMVSDIIQERKAACLSGLLSAWIRHEQEAE